MGDLVRAIEAQIAALQSWLATDAYVAACRGEFLRPYRFMDPDDPPVRCYSSPGTLNAIHTHCGLEQFCCLQADYPDLVPRWLDALTQVSVAHAHAVAPLALSPLASHFRGHRLQGPVPSSHRPCSASCFFRASLGSSQLGTSTASRCGFTPTGI